MQIQLHTVNLEVADPQATKRFYVGALGMTEDLRRSHPPGFVYLESGGVDLTLATPPDGAGQAAPSRTVEIGFRTDDLDALRARLTQLGISGFRPQSMGWADVLEGHDLDGHRVIVYRFREEGARG